MSIYVKWHLIYLMPVWTEIPLVPNWFLKEMINVFIFKMEPWSLIFFSRIHLIWNNQTHLKNEIIPLGSIYTSYK